MQSLRGMAAFKRAPLNSVSAPPADLASEQPAAPVAPSAAEQPKRVARLLAAPDSDGRNGMLEIVQTDGDADRYILSRSGLPEFDYALTRLDAPQPVYAVRLPAETKDAFCSCPSFTYRKNRSEHCKHIKALVVLTSAGRLNTPRS